MNTYRYLFEAEKGEIPEIQDDDVKVGKKTRLARDSVDDQIDSLLVKYESESIRDEAETLEESFYKKSLKTFLFEQEEALDPAADEEATTGSEIIDEEEPAEEEQPDLDIDQFGSKVARLVMNYQQLLKIETAIVNRAVEFIQKNYDDEHVERLYAILEEQYDIQIDPDFAEEEERARPLGLGAYDGGSGGGAG